METTESTDPFIICEIQTQQHIVFEKLKVKAWKWALQRSQTGELVTFPHIFFTDKVRTEDSGSDPQGCSLAPHTARPPADSLHRRV